MQDPDRAGRPSGEPTLDELIEALRRLPGIGQKSAQRIAYQVLQNDPPAASRLAVALGDAVARIGHCARCHTLTERTLCAVCGDASRDAHQLCVVETPADQAAIERSGSYRGLYFVLLGRLSPLDGIGVAQIGAAALLQRAADGVVQEVILATSFTAEGEATAHALAELLKPRGLKVTRLARGVPAGSELEYVDLSTLAHAFVSRR